MTCAHSADRAPPPTKATGSSRRRQKRSTAWCIQRAFSATPSNTARATSALWAQVMADVLGRRVQRVADPTSANLRGAALLAFAALGELDVSELHGRAPVAAVHEPDPATQETYAMLFKAFKHVYKASRRSRGRLAAVRDREAATA